MKSASLEGFDRLSGLLQIQHLAQSKCLLHIRFHYFSFCCPMFGAYEPQMSSSCLFVCLSLNRPITIINFLKCSPDHVTPPYSHCPKGKSLYHSETEAIQPNAAFLPRPLLMLSWPLHCSQWNHLLLSLFEQPAHYCH